MTHAEYMRATLAFQKRHRAVAGRILGAVTDESLAKMGKALPGQRDAFKDAVMEQQAMLLAMLKAGEEFTSDA